MHPEQVVVHPLQKDEDAGNVLRCILEQHQEFKNEIFDTISGAGVSEKNDPFQWQPVLTIRKEGEQGGVDFRTGDLGKISSVGRFLPLPPELKA